MPSKSIVIDPADVLTVTVSSVVPPPTPPVEPPVEPPRAKPRLGVNLAGPDDWNAGARAKMFNDVWLTARCIAGDPNTGPSKWRVLTVSGGARGAKIAGKYTLQASGGGIVTSSNGTISGGVLTVLDDTRDVDINFSAALTGPVRLLRDASSTAFTTPEFRRFMAPFGFVRFMDLTVTNWDGPEDAAQRAAQLGPDGLMQWGERPSDAGPYHRPWGISYEAAIRIANECNCDPWFCLSHAAGDQFFTGLGAELAAKLNPNLNAYIEFSNELWNYSAGFFQSGMVRDAALKHVADGKLPKLNDNDNNPYYLAQRYALMRLHDAWAAMSPALGSRLRPIFASQYGGDLGNGIETTSGYFGNVLMWGKRTYGNNDWLYGLACAPYIYADEGTSAQIIAALGKDVDSRGVAGGRLAHMRALCDGHLKNNNLFFYEVGVDMGQGTDNLQARIGAAYDPSMRGLVHKFLSTHFEWAGLAGAAWFNGCSRHDMWGPAWGLTDDAADLTQPMYAGAADFTAIAQPEGGVTAEYFAKTDFTQPLEKKVIPLLNHAWAAWGSGTLHHGQNPQWTEGKDGSIRFSGRYVGKGRLTAECEASDTASLRINADGTWSLDYVARFGGNGSCWVRLIEVLPDGSKRIAPTGVLRPN